MLKNEFREAFREITMLGFGLIFISHSKEKATEMRDEDGNAVTAMAPDLPTAAYTIVNSIVDIIGYISVEMTNDGKSERYFYTRQTPTIFAGSRYKYLKPKIKFGYNELVDAIAEAIEMSAEKDGAEIDENGTENYRVEGRPFQEVMEEVKNFWLNYLSTSQSDEEKEQKVNTMNDIIQKVFGRSIKLSQAVPSQQDLVELVLDEFKQLID